MPITPEHRAAKKRHREKDIEAARAKDREYARRSREKGNTARWRANNVEKARTCTRNWMRKMRQADPEAARRKVREWNAANSARVKERDRRRYADNPIPKIEGAKQYRARRLGAPICDFTLEQWDELLMQFGNRCGYCGKSGAMTQDHMIPLSRGGSHTLCNIVPACLSCNTQKNDKTVDEYADWLTGARAQVASKSRKRAA